jgi:hypothetical protein
MLLKVVPQGGEVLLLSRRGSRNVVDIPNLHAQLLLRKRSVIDRTRAIIMPLAILG